jgi:hypothetical protein
VGICPSCPGAESKRWAAVQKRAAILAKCQEDR